tara:strand:+ start:282 stop:1673 length:1392 start_codon:yes stop_codon:yes gene_type:complete
VKEIFRTTKHIHFIGIGGIGMSGMAELLLNHNFTISGSDITKTKRTKYLEKLGIKINYKHNKSNIKNAYDLVVYSSAVNKKNKEILSAKDKNIPIMKRSRLLGELIKIKDISIGVSGTHGKTTTSSMLGAILHESKLEPTLIIGGIVNKFNSNNISGDGNIIVVEADEFDRSFLELKPTYSIVNNLDLEHLDCYNNIEDLKQTFTKFSNSIPFYGKIAINNDSEYLNQISSKINKPKITFGIDNKADIMCEIISFKKNKSKFKIISKIYENFIVELNCPGKHNIYNALAASCIALELKIDIKIIKKALKTYSGVKRRFELKHIDKKNNIILIDDYAHHPIEIEYTINAAKKGWNSRIIIIFEPHLYSRTKDFYKEFANALSLADYCIITDIYGARENPIEGVSSQMIVNKLNKNNCIYIQNKNDVSKKLYSIIKKNDMIILMGAGKINSIIDDTIKTIKEKYE